MYCMGLTKFQKLAKDAKACYKIGQMVLVNTEILDEYLETFRIVDDDFYRWVTDMTNKLNVTTRGFLHDSNVSERYIITTEVAEYFGVTEE